MMEHKRYNASFDCLRIVSNFAVVFWHAASMIWKQKQRNSEYWSVGLLIRTITRFSNPIYFMISGYFLLRSEQTKQIGTLFQTRIKHLLEVYIFWNTLSILVDTLLWKREWSVFWKSLEKPWWQLWYLQATIQMTMINPFLLSIIKTSSLVPYYIILYFIRWSVLPIFREITVVSSVFSWLYRFIPLLPEYSGYYLLGYYLGSIKVSTLKKQLIYLFALFSFVMFYLTCYFKATFFQMSCDFSWSIHSPWVPPQVTAIFLFCLTNSVQMKSPEGERKLRYLARVTFGIYLLHTLIQNILRASILAYPSIDFYQYIIRMTLMSYAISLVLSVIIHALPFHSFIM